MKGIKGKTILFVEKLCRSTQETEPAAKSAASPVCWMRATLGPYWCAGSGTIALANLCMVISSGWEQQVVEFGGRGMVAVVIGEPFFEHIMCSPFSETGTGEKDACFM